MATEKQNRLRQVYNAPGEVNVLAQIQELICVLSRRCILAAGINQTGNVVTMHYMAYTPDKTIWDMDFFDYSFATEPIFVAKEKMKKVFFCSEKEMISPDALFEKGAVEQWLQKIYFLEQTDVCIHKTLPVQQVHISYAIPLNIRELISINFKNAEILPFSIYHLECKVSPNYFTKLCLTSEQAMVSIYSHQKLIWHKIFPYIRAEDVAYEIRLVCAEHNIDANRMLINANYLDITEYVIVNELSQFFAAIRTGEGQKIEDLWGPVLSLIQQLKICV